MDELTKLISKFKTKKLLPGSLYNQKTWLEIISDLLDPWKALYETFIEKLYENVYMKNNKIFDKYHRIAYRLDPENKNKIKSPMSITEKILRMIDEDNSCVSFSNPEKFIIHYMQQIDDIARCRILCNYNSDLDEIDKYLISTEFLNILRKMQVKYYKSKRNDIRIEAGKSFKKGAHRAVHEYFGCEVSGKTYFIEVQIMTFLQEAWDAKEHIIYEKIRKGKKDEKITYIEDRFHALSGLLLIADEFADNTWNEYKKRSR